MVKRKGAMEEVVVRQDFWRGKHVFITGHTGFKGSWLSLWLQNMGAIVTGYSLAPSNDMNMFEMARVAEGMKSLIGDVRELSVLTKAMVEARPDIVLHLAAQSLVVHSFKAPVETYSTNVMGTVNLLEAIRSVPSVRVVLVVTTDKCYENREWVWGYRETDGLGGYDPYSSSKACAELVCSAYRSSFFNSGNYNLHSASIASARAGNVIGGGDWAQNRIVPDLLTAFAQGKCANVRNPNAVRPWQHVLDPLQAYLVLSEKLWEYGAEFSEAWNFGPAFSDCKPVRWIADHLSEKWGNGASWTTTDTLPYHETNFLTLDCSKAKNKLGWSPRWGLTQTLEAVVDWYKAYIAGSNLRNFTLEQIRRFNH